MTNLCDNYQAITLPEADKEIGNIKQQSETILELLSHKFNVTAPSGSPVGTSNVTVPNGSPVGTSNQKGKEESHE